MPHHLIVGDSGTGKTTLCMSLARRLKTKFAVLVLTPLTHHRWPCYWLTDNPDRFLAVMRQSRNCILIIDESGEMIGHNKEMQFLATRSRNYGHHCLFLSQRAHMVHPNTRRNCDWLTSFMQPGPDAEPLAHEFNQPRLPELLPILPKLRYYHMDKWSQPRAGSLA